MKNNPLFSIITVSFNSAKTIEKTILSVLNQTYKNIEYIIIDGGSIDGTLDIINKYKDKISYIVSEKDGGIYDAMNKGTAVARGDYLNFMNSDDYFFSDSIIEECLPFLNDKYDIVYGDVEVRYNNFKFIKKKLPPKYLWAAPANHQSAFIKRETMSKYGYNISNKIVADYEFFLTVYYNGGKILKINKVIASFYSGGYSQQNYRQSILDCYQTVAKFDKSLKVKIFYKILLIKPLIKKYLPNFLFKFLRKISN